tara:strand:+ start:60922 stop:61158 length:237 start_codon:yes stop_codon:yes gene_type:complete
LRNRKIRFEKQSKIFLTLPQENLIPEIVCIERAGSVKPILREFELQLLEGLGVTGPNIFAHRAIRGKLARLTLRYMAE